MSVEQGRTPEIVEQPALRGRIEVFEDRADGGNILADLLTGRVGVDAILLAIPSGGVPVAAAVAERLDLPLDVAVVSKVTFADNPEAGFGAVAFDGTVELNQELIDRTALSADQVAERVELTRRKVQHRLRKLRGDRPPPDLAGRASVLIDDGLASGFTLRVAARAIRNSGADRVVVAVPTAHEGSIARLSGLADLIVCPNIRSGLPFNVADAYRQWRDVYDFETAELLARYL